MIHARIAMEAQQTILREHPMILASALCHGLHAEFADYRTADEFSNSRAIIVLPVGDGVCPAFQFTVGHGHQVVLPVVAEVNQLLDAASDPWGVASWWLSPSGIADDSRSPAQLAVDGRHADDLRSLAYDLLAD